MTTRSAHIEDEAIGWFVRLQGEDSAEADFIAFRDWLEASADHRAAFARVEEVWSRLSSADETKDAPFAATLPRPATRPDRRWMAWSAGGLAAAAAAAAVLIAPSLTVSPEQVFQTAKGERRDVVLADGSHLYLNSASTARVRFRHNGREVALTSGEAVFDVVHDAKRPFEVSAGDVRIRDIGTVFDVRRDAERLTVTVLQGEVEVRRGKAAPVKLAQADQIRLESDAALQSHLTAPEEVSDWRRGRLIYRDQTLAEIAADLNRYLPTPVQVDDRAAALRFSGVLQLDDEAVMMRRLEGLMPVQALTTPTGVQITVRN